MYYYNPPSAPLGEGRFRPKPQDLKKTLVCVAIIVIVLLSKRWDSSATNFVVSKAKYLVLEYNHEPQKIAEALQETIKGLGAVTALAPVEQPIPETPVSGEIVSAFGYRWHPILNENRMHNGIDISASEGSPVRAALGGVVVEAAVEPELGNVVRLRHADGITTVYGHLKDVYVREQDHVKIGLIIGSVGKTGLAQAPHLHFEVWQGEKARDPEEWLRLQ